MHSETPPKTTVCEHGLLLHSQMPGKPPPSLGPNFLKSIEAKYKTVLWPDKSKLKIPFETPGHWVLRAEKERGHPACYHSTVQKPACQCTSAQDMGDLRAPFMLNDICRFSSYIRCHPQDVFSKKAHLCSKRVTRSKTTKEVSNCWAAQIVHQARMMKNICL